MKKLVLFTFAFLFLIVQIGHTAARPNSKKGMYWVSSIAELQTLDPTGAGTPNQYDLIDGDAAILVSLSGVTTDMSIYIFDASSEEAESSPDIIRPTNYTTGVWLMSKVTVSELIARPSATPGLVALDSGAPGSDKEIGKLYWNDDGVGGDGSEYGDFNLQTMYNGSEVDMFAFDASGNLITIGGPDRNTSVQADGIPGAEDGFSCGMIVWLTAGDAVAEFDLVMMQTDGYVDQADATGVPIGFAVLCNDTWPATAETDLVGVCLIGSGGVIRNDDWTGHTAGEIVYVVDADGTAGTFDPADEIDLEDGDHWTAVGVMQEEDVIIFPVPAWATDDGT